MNEHFDSQYPYGNHQNPQSPSGGNGFYPPPDAPYQPPTKKPRFLSSVFKNPRMRGNRELLFIALFAGLAFLASISLSALYSAVIVGSPTLTDLYRNSLNFRYCCDILYSVFCVGSPFLLLLPILRRLGLYKESIPLEKPKKDCHLPLLIFISVGICFVGNIITSYFSVLVQSTGIRFYSYEMALEGNEIENSPVGIALFFIRTALVPALVEEFAFRGALLQPLRKFGDWYAILITSVMFGFMHGNMTQMPFALLAGISLGYVAVVADSLWASISVHFINNFISAAYSVYLLWGNQSVAIIATNIVTYALILLGLASLVIYAYKNPVFYRLYPCKYGFLPHKIGSWFITPTVLAALILYISDMFADIIWY